MITEMCEEARVSPIMWPHSDSPAHTPFPLAWCLLFKTSLLVLHGQLCFPPHCVISLSQHHIRCQYGCDGHVPSFPS